MNNIAGVRKQVRNLEDETAALAAEADTAAEADIYDRLALELHDLDRALYNAVFINNDSEIEALTDGIRNSAAGADRVHDQISDVVKSLGKARDHVKKADKLRGRAKNVLGSVRTLTAKLQA